ncbi:anti-repressor protein [Nitrosospira sp. Nsp13]|nr:anti-repressor protein [Nitrosospira sp. Nsp13]
MNELIKVEDRNIGDGQVQAINARELHAFLGVKSEFRNWIKNRIDDFGFIDEQDFAMVGKNLPGGGRQTDYYVTLDMAKELAMVERNEKGKQARQYFIECERRAKSNVVDIHSALANPTHLRGMLLAYTEKVLALEAKVQEQAPKAQFHDAVAEAINCQSVQEVAKVLGTGQNRLFRFLRQEGLLMPNNLPYQQHIDAGYFRVVERQYNDRLGESHTYTRTLVTGKGLTFIQQRLTEKRALEKESSEEMV